MAIRSDFMVKKAFQVIPSHFLDTFAKPPCTAEVQIKYVNLIPLMPPRAPTPVVSHQEIGVQTEFEYSESGSELIPPSPEPVASPTPIPPTPSQTPPPPTPPPVMESVACNTDLSLGMADCNFERICALITSEMLPESGYDEWTRKANRLKFAGMQVDFSIDCARTPSPPPPPESDQNCGNEEKSRKK